MSYTVFALKWRPRDFDEIIGQPAIVSTLKNAIQGNRLAHAYLFAGPRGVGKTSTARILAKALNCKAGPTIKPCLKCSSCMEISEGRSLDVIEIDGASNRGIDEIRVLRENVKFSPTAGKFKIYIIDEVHMLTTEAFNALLKTLEEPPEFVKFIFATTQPHKVIPTILSRCQRFDFRRIPALEISAQLERIAASEKIEVDKEVLFTIAKSSDGSLRDAESILDQLIAFSLQKISLKDVISVLGLVEQEALFAITDKIISKDARGALGLLNALIDEGKDIGVFLSGMVEHFRNLMIAKVTRGDSKLIDLPLEVCEKLLKQSESFSLEEIFAAFNVLIATQEMTKRLDSLRIPLEISLIRLAHGRRPPAGKDETQKPGEDLKRQIPAEQLPKAKPIVEQHGAEHDKKENENTLISLDSIRGAWQNIIDNLGKIKMSLATYLSEGEPLKLQGSALTISFPKNYSLHKESLEKKDNKAIIEKIFFELFNTDFRLNFILSQEVKDRQNETNNTFIKSALEMFNGRVIKEE
ncbi:MAG: DNA polymerase III, subunit gamma and tau [Omnitrophica WOR_2 bacterium RBG_13_44_8b]|nr:MAG: DNA polymerase III, subunit gamma and tau [Omnitrophica WOR_2 bacterium RBG_13_44_8b]